MHSHAPADPALYAPAEELAIHRRHQSQEVGGPGRLKEGAGYSHQEQQGPAAVYGIGKMVEAVECYFFIVSNWSVPQVPSMKPGTFSSKGQLSETPPAVARTQNDYAEAPIVFELSDRLLAALWSFVRFSEESSYSTLQESDDSLYFESQSSC